MWEIETTFIRRASTPVGDAVNGAALIVADEKRAMAIDRQSGGASGVLAIDEPTRHEVCVARGAAAREFDEDHFVARWRAAIPRSVKGDERPAAVGRRKLLLVVKRDAKRR